MKVETNTARTIYYVYGKCEIITPTYTPPPQPPIGFQELTEEEMEYVHSEECLRSPTWQSLRQPSKMNHILVERFYQAFLKGAGYPELQAMFSLKKHNVWDLLHGKTWKNYKSPAKTQALKRVADEAAEKKRRLAMNKKYIHKYVTA